ncbi:flowering time control protein FPA-like isoform X3 [Cynara cardunculus var. scolymus]|uniref:flowering time control protein FPA-like isoform X3 n=1 Tax=Cynara cardunculus var. scolymus TaxID=59895 RepID=UPI000D62FB0F|nr:flowering time control protein FPA-like isoform X3 [Cynara cardunculus var. scolymus]
MSRSFKSNNQGGCTAAVTGNNKPSESSWDTVSCNLWVGNLAADVSDSDLRNLFEKHGCVETITCYPSRNYAFIYLKGAEDAKRARDNLQGVVLRGNPLKIDFAKPAKPCKSLWVSGISTSILKEDLEEEFSKFGKIEDFKFQRDKNSAYIDYCRLEDASKALKAMHGKQKGGTMIRVDYLRSHSRRSNYVINLFCMYFLLGLIKQDQGPDFHEPKEGQHYRSMGLVSPWLPQDPARNYSDPLNYGSNRLQPILPSEGLKGDKEQPSNVLLISYPPVVHIDEQMLHNAMILFGEIERIRSFPSRYCSFVEFRSVEEAQLAKEGLQGKLFNDSRISITFKINDVTLNQHPNGFLPGIEGPRPNSLFNEVPFQAAQLDAIGLPIVPNSFHGRAVPHGVGGPVTSMRPFAPPGGPNWRSSPSSGMLSSPSVSRNPSTKPTLGSWDIYDASQIQREPKRLRTGDAVPLKENNDRVLPTDQICRGVPQVKGVGPSNTRFTSRNPDIGRPRADSMWRGIIAKGGIPVCHARCVPVGDWIGYEIPEIVNCSARTGLDLLSKHYADAVGFDISFFLPDSEEDFASYTELLRYLGDHNRAGVSKFDDGTTLFLVPPSEFLTTVLKVSGPERLYGVVLKFPQHASDSISGPSISQPQQIDKLQVPSQNEHGVVPKDEKMLQNTYSGVSHELPRSHPEPLGPITSNPQPAYLVPPVTSTCTTPAGLSLTPELVATLASLAKINSNGLQPGANTVTGSLLTSVASDERQFQGRNEHETSNLAGPYVQQVGSTFQSQAQILPQHQPYLSNTVGALNLAVTQESHIQGLSFNMPHHEAVASMTNSNIQTPQGVQFALPMQATQQYQLDYSQDMHTDSGFQKNTEAPSVIHPGFNAVTSSGQLTSCFRYIRSGLVLKQGERTETTKEVPFIKGQSSLTTWFGWWRPCALMVLRFLYLNPKTSLFVSYFAKILFVHEFLMLLFYTTSK